MSWEISREATRDVVFLDRDMCIQDAAEFCRAVMPLAGSGKPLRVDAGAVRSIHTSTMQILYALSQAVPDFAVTRPTEEFSCAEVRVGLAFPRSEASPRQDDPPGNLTVPYDQYAQ